MAKPLILITNDDGIAAPGIRALIAVMKEIGASALPTFMVYKNGKLSWKKEGIVTLQELKEALTK